ncbi:patatin-like phospholipase family protein [Parasphingorhabdus sp. DH2-15]|uniref:patatin-like phospholipase family protein n=1 Tax=Parasphingorhabdus sp. DH2-15 TaxID=3444112 RepID=UPI003F685201
MAKMAESKERTISWAKNALFSELSEGALLAIDKAAERRKISGGTFLVRQGEEADTLFFVVTGRFRVIIQDGSGVSKTVARIDAGEPVGELAFFGGGTRTASLQAIRDSQVIALDRSDYEALVNAHPEISAALLKAVSRRLAKVTARTASLEASTPRVIACLAAGDSPLPEDFHRRLAHAMQGILGAQHVVACVSAGDAPDGDDHSYQQWLAQHEEKGTWLLLDANGDDARSSMITRNADALLMVGDAMVAAKPVSPKEQAALQAIDSPNRTLALLRSSGDTPISGTCDWLEGRQPHLHHHIALDNDGDFAKLARFLTGNAVGLVLAGGGALGCAHLGIVRGLQKANIPIDFIGGTSAGAAMGGAIAQGDSVAQTLDQMEAMFIAAKAMRRFTVPVHSLLDPSVFDAELQTRYSTKDIADQPINFFGISTNLSTNDLHVHRHGPLWEAVRASGSLPTILPPFIDSDGNILIDGGVLDNIPVNMMRKMKTGPNIVVTLGDTQETWRVDAQYDSLRSRLGLLRDVVLRRPAPDDFPSIVDIMSRSMVVASRIASKAMLRDGDIVLQPPIVEGMQILDWHLGRKQAEIAADYVTQQLSEHEGLAALQGK